MTSVKLSDSRLCMTCLNTSCIIDAVFILFRDILLSEGLVFIPAIQTAYAVNIIAPCWICNSHDVVGEVFICVHIFIFMCSVSVVSTSVFFNLFSKSEPFAALNPCFFGGTPETQRAEIRGRRPRAVEGFLGRVPSPPARDLGSAVSSTSRVRGGASTANTFWTY